MPWVHYVLHAAHTIVAERCAGDVADGVGKSDGMVLVCIHAGRINYINHRVMFNGVLVV